MGRKSLVDKKTEINIDVRRKSALEKFFGLTDKVLKHIQWSIESTKPCTACSLIKDEFIPGKAKTEDGKCAFCFNTGLVPDKDQRNWATSEVVDRISPKPKAVEVSGDKSEDRDEIEKEVQALDNTKLDEALRAMGVTFVAEDKQP